MTPERKKQIYTARDNPLLMDREAFDAGFDSVKEIHAPSHQCGFQAGAFYADANPVSPDEKDDETAADEYATVPAEEPGEEPFIMKDRREDFLAGRQSLRREKDAEIERLKGLLREARGWCSSVSLLSEIDAVLGREK